MLIREHFNDLCSYTDVLDSLTYNRKHTNTTHAQHSNRLTENQLENDGRDAWKKECMEKHFRVEENREAQYR